MKQSFKNFWMKILNAVGVTDIEFNLFATNSQRDEFSEVPGLTYSP